MNEEIYTVGEMKRAIRNGAEVRVTSTVLLGGGISLKVSKAEVMLWLKGESNDQPLNSGAGVYFDQSTNTVYI